MSKLINVSEESWANLMAEIIQEIKGKRSIKGEFNYKFTNPDVNRQATILFTPDAYAKLVSLVMIFDKEVGWYCTCRRDGELEDDLYIIDDVLVFPQTTTSTTVDSDDNARVEWFDSLPIDVLTNITCDCHSHVNMGVTPSGTDDKDMQSVLDNLPEDGFRIFMIWNKKLEYSVKIFDLAKNVMFETKDVTVDVLGMKMMEFLERSKSMVKAKTYSTYTYGGTNNYYPSLNNTTTSKKNEEIPEKSKEKEEKVEENEDEDDFDIEFDDEEFNSLLEEMSRAELMEAYEAGLLDDDDFEYLYWGKYYGGDYRDYGYRERIR